MCSNHIPVGFVTTRATTIAITRFVPLTTVRTGLTCVGFVDFLKFYVLSIELVFENLHHFAKIPVREFLRNFSFANFLFVLSTILFLSTRSVAFYAFWITTKNVFDFVFYAPVHEIFCDFMCLVFYLVT